MAIVRPPPVPGGKRPLGSSFSSPLDSTRLDSTQQLCVGISVRRMSSDVLLLSASAYESNTHEQ